MRHRVVLSESNDPYYNMAMEALLMEKLTEDQVILFLYVNKPSVVIGRNQNPWREIHIEEAEKHKIHVVRRLSGGGTVYHDLKNLNYAFIYPKKRQRVEENFHVVLESLASLGVELRLTERKDLFYKTYKVSGNAFYQKGQSAIHHGTLLVDVNLDDLWQVLKFDSEALKGKMVASVRSRVKNLKDIQENLDLASVMRALVTSFAPDQVITTTTYLDKTQGFQEKLERYHSWEWIFGQTPSFKYQHMGTEYHIKHGMIHNIAGHNRYGLVIQQIFDLKELSKEVDNVS